MFSLRATISNRILPNHGYNQWKKTARRLPNKLKSISAGIFRSKACNPVMFTSKVWPAESCTTTSGLGSKPSWNNWSCEKWWTMGYWLKTPSFTFFCWKQAYITFMVGDWFQPCGLSFLSLDLLPWKPWLPSFTLELWGLDSNASWKRSWSHGESAESWVSMSCRLVG